jgi:hypothetical protein
MHMSIKNRVSKAMFDVEDYEIGFVFTRCRGAFQPGMALILHHHVLHFSRKIIIVISKMPSDAIKDYLS